MFNSMQMCKIPHLSQRLDLLLTVRELPVSMRDLEPVSNMTPSQCVCNLNLPLRQQRAKWPQCRLQSCVVGEVFFGFGFFLFFFPIAKRLTVHSLSNSQCNYPGSIVYKRPFHGTVQKQQAKRLKKIIKKNLYRSCFLFLWPAIRQKRISPLKFNSFWGEVLAPQAERINLKSEILRASLFDQHFVDIYYFQKVEGGCSP